MKFLIHKSVFMTISQIYDLQKKESNEQRKKLK